MSNNSFTSSDLLITLLTVLFVGLKLTGYIDWSWIWVLSPLWIGSLISLTITLVAVLITVLIAFSLWIYNSITGK